MIFVQRSVLRQFLEPHHLRLGRRGAARQLRRRHQRRQMRGLRPADGLPSFPKPGAAGLLYERARRDPCLRRGHADHHQPHGHVQRPRLFRMGQGNGRGQLGQLSGHGHSAELHRHVPRPDARHRRQQAVHADGTDPEPAELVPVLQSQASRRSAQAELAGRVAWRGHRAVLPDEAVDRRLRTIPWRGHRARWHRTVACLQGDRGARRGTGPHRQADHGIGNPCESRHRVRLAKLLVSRRLRRTNRRILLSERSAPLLSRVLATQRARRHHRKHHASRQAQTIRSGGRARPHHRAAGRRRNAGILRIRRRQLHNRLHGRHPRRTRPRGAGRLSRQIARPDGRMGGGNRRARAGRDHRSAWRRG